jgi:hypothetical protein
MASQEHPTQMRGVSTNFGRPLNCSRKTTRSRIAAIRSIFLCDVRHSFSPIPRTILPQWNGENDGGDSDRIHGRDCNHLSRIPTILNQSTTYRADGVKNGTSRSTRAAAGFSVVGLFRAYRCGNLRFHLCLVAVETRGKRRRLRAIARWAYQSIQLSPLQ